MNHAIYKVESFKIVGPHTLNVHFDDGTSRRIDFTPILRGERFGPLRDLLLFEQVSLDPEVHTLVWPNGADFDPATLHDWPQQPDDVSTAVARWQQIKVPEDAQDLADMREAKKQEGTVPGIGLTEAKKELGL